MSNFIKDTLEPGEVIIHKGKLHWLFIAKHVICGSLIILISAIVLLFAIADDQDEIMLMCVFFVLLGIGMICWGYFLRKKTEFAITSNRFIQKDGILDISLTEIPLYKIETVNFQQTLYERLWETGTLELVGSGGTSHKISFVEEPFKVRRILTTQMKQKT